MKSSNLIVIGSILVVSAVLIIAEETAPEMKKCQKPCERHCDPVCGIKKDGTKKEFSNMCLYENYACENPEDIVSVTKGKCVPRSTTEVPSTSTTGSTTT